MIDCNSKIKLLGGKKRLKEQNFDGVKLFVEGELCGILEIEVDMLRAFKSGTLNTMTNIGLRGENYQRDNHRVDL